MRKCLRIAIDTDEGEMGELLQHCFGMTAETEGCINDDGVGSCNGWGKQRDTALEEHWCVLHPCLPFVLSFLAIRSDPPPLHRSAGKSDRVKRGEVTTDG